MDTLRSRLLPPSYSVSTRSSGVRSARTVKFVAANSRLSLCKPFATGSSVPSSRKVTGPVMAIQAGSGENAASSTDLAAG